MLSIAAGQQRQGLGDLVIDPSLGAVGVGEARGADGAGILAGASEPHYGVLTLGAFLVREPGTMPPLGHQTT